jgi:AcrR family transcriptional regulator
MSLPEAALKDGRRRRAHDSRQRIVAAMIELVGEGQITPSAEDVAARATVGLRTVFRHFSDMESLYAALTSSLVEQYEMWLIPFESLDWRGQLDEVIERRTATYERLLPFKRAGDAHRHMSASIQAEHARIRDVLRHRLATLLPAPIREDPARFEMIDLMLSLDVWQRLRDEQHLPAETARSLIRREVLRVVAE